MPLSSKATTTGISLESFCGKIAFISLEIIHECMMRSEINDNRRCVCVTNNPNLMHDFVFEEFSHWKMIFVSMLGIWTHIHRIQHCFHRCRRRLCCCCSCGFLSFFGFIHETPNCNRFTKTVSHIVSYFFILFCLPVCPSIHPSIHIYHSLSTYVDVQFVHGAHKTSDMYILNPLNRWTVSYHTRVCVDMRACIPFCRRFAHRSKLSFFYFISFFFTQNQ